MKTFSKEKIVFFHEGTLSGKAGAYAAFKALQGTAQFEGIDYSTLGKIHEYDLSEKIVYIIGLSIALKHLDHISFSAKKIVYIDHYHKGTSNLLSTLPARSRQKFEVVQSERRAGCCLAWKYFVEDKPIPDLYLAIEDIEMSRKPPQIYNSFYICSGLNVYPDFVSLTSFFQNNLNTLRSGENLSKLIASGQNNHKFLESLVKNYLTKACYYEILNNIIPVLNIPKTFGPRCLEELASKAGMAMSYTDSANQRYWSLRTHPDSNLDSGKISSLLGGGGSGHTGGFVTSIKVTPEDLNILFKQALSESVNKDILLIEEEK
jgi:hypothetical protein